jgi:hypothetical protein
MRYSLLLLLATPCFSFAADQIGFSLGNTSTAVALSGQVSVSCPANKTSGAGPTTVIFTCRNVVLEPSAYDYFLGPKGVNANEVSLVATHEDGSLRTKSDSYDPKLARTTSAFNLWISTLFQRPLLKEGHNKISYTLVLNKAAVGQGTFEVLVQQGESRQCPVSHYSSLEPSDCESPFTVCERYFTQYDNCTLN